MTIVSIVIPTYNRDADLRELLYIILMQTILPLDVIVVDDSDNNDTKDLIEQMRDDFVKKGIILNYNRGGEKREKSISRARNIGAAQAKGEIILFLDDDVILDKQYIEEIINVYKKHPNAVGVQGYITNWRNVSSARALLSNLIDRAFFLFHTEKDRCRILPSGNITYPHPLSRVIGCEWLSGTNSSYKRDMFRRFKFDQKLKEYSFCEDADLSIRIRKEYPDSLYITPHAKILHKASPVARRDNRRLVHIRTAYQTYFFYKNIEQTWLNKVIFLWSMFSRLITMLTEKRAKSMVFLIKSYVYTLNHFDEVKKGNFAFLSIP